jgi:uncharacterized protein (DUF1015 family)
MCIIDIWKLLSNQEKNTQAMARISAFLPLRYNPEQIADPGAVVAPPYDVINEELRRRLVERDLHNVIRLILPEGDEETKYNHAMELLTTWIAEGVLLEEPAAAIYPYAQIFSHPVTGDRIERRGFIAALGLEPFSAGIVLPHERTLSGPKADRLKLMEATDADLEAIFGIYRDVSGASSARLDELMEHQTPLIEATDIDGVKHRLWRIAAPEIIEEFTQDLADEVVFIVDGHHRYETALNYREERHRDNPNLPADAPVDYIMMFMAPTSDPGLLILPTHRVIHSLPNFDSNRLQESLLEHFELQKFDGVDDAVKALEERSDRPGYILLAGDSTVLATLRREIPAESLVGQNLPPALGRLDVTVLHEYILERLLGISKEAQAAQTNLRYVKTVADARKEAERDDVQLVVLMNPTKLNQVEEVAQTGEVMPQKSTYFYPKLASGLLFYPLRTRE